MSNNFRLITILGPTASGKTKLAVALAHQIGGEIISADSRQVYREMDIGTGKDLEEYIIDNQNINYHLIDIIDAGESYHIHRFQEDFQKIFTDINAKYKPAILCGGSGMYLDAVLKGYQFTGIPIDENLREILIEKPFEELLIIFQKNTSVFSELADTSTKKRLIRAIEINQFLLKNPEFHIPASTTPNSIIFGLNPDVELRRERITKRLHERLQNGMIEEVKALIDKGIPPEKLIYYGLEYKFITQFLQGEMNFETMKERLNVAIHQFAKRQMTFFRKMERDGLKINWLDTKLPLNKIVEEILEKCL
jgi:tRNA dimethylallyltransferase